MHYIAGSLLHLWPGDFSHRGPGIWNVFSCHDFSMNHVGIKHAIGMVGGIFINDEIGMCATKWYLCSAQNGWVRKLYNFNLAFKQIIGTQSEAAQVVQDPHPWKHATISQKVDGIRVWLRCLWNCDLSTSRLFTAANTQHNKHAIITSKGRFDVIIKCSLRLCLRGPSPTTYLAKYLYGFVLVGFVVAVLT